MISKEKVSGWIENHTGRITLITGLIGIIIGLAGLVITTTLTWRSIGEMVVVILFLVILAISLVITIKSTIHLIRKPLKDEIEKLKSNFKEEKEDLKSKLEGETKQYNDLFNKTKPLYPIDRLITTEVEYNPIGKVGIEGNPPYLIFDIRVVNRTNYHFTPKKAFLACYPGKDIVFKDDWEERAKTPHIIISELQRLGDGSIQFHVPKENIENNMRELKFKKGYVEYTTEEDIIHNTQRKSVKVNITNLEYKLDDEKTQEPKGRVITAK